MGQKCLTPSLEKRKETLEYCNFYGNLSIKGTLISALMEKLGVEIQKERKLMTSMEVRNSFESIVVS